MLIAIALERGVRQRLKPDVSSMVGMVSVPDMLSQAMKFASILRWLYAHPFQELAAEKTGIWVTPGPRYRGDWQVRRFQHLLCLFQPPLATSIASPLADTMGGLIRGAGSLQIDISIFAILARCDS